MCEIAQLVCDFAHILLVFGKKCVALWRGKKKNGNADFRTFKYTKKQQSVY